MKKILVMLFIVLFAVSAHSFTPVTYTSDNLSMAPMSSVMAVDSLTSSMQHRVGELMWLEYDSGLFNHKDNAFWIRGFGSISDYYEVDFNFAGTEIGYDRQVMPNVFVGVTALFAGFDSELDLDGIACDMGLDGMAYGMGLYLIAFTDTGWFFDVSARYIRTDIDVKVSGEKAEIGRNNISAVFEIGKETAFSNGVFLIPSGSIGILVLGEGSEDTPYGKYSFDNSDIFRANANIMLGKRIATSYGAAQPYFKLGAKYSKGKSYSSIPAGTMNDDIDIFKIEGAAGADFRIRDRWFVYAEGGYAYNSDASDINLMAGIRYEFGSKTERTEQPESVTLREEQDFSPVIVDEEPEPVITNYVENDLNVSIEETHETYDVIIAGFATNDYHVPPSALVSIKEAYARIKTGNDDISIQITGHTDVTGRAEYNQRLSLQRAQNVKEALVKEGFPEEIFTIEGKGAAEPLESNATAEGRKLNRRVEINIR